MDQHIQKIMDIIVCLDKEVQHLNEFKEKLQYYIKINEKEKIKQQQISIVNKLRYLKRFLNDLVRFIDKNRKPINGLKP